jgi:hypothetical protein
VQLRQVRDERLRDELVKRLDDPLGLPPGQTECCVNCVNDGRPWDLCEQISDKICLLLLVFAGHRRIVRRQRQKVKPRAPMHRGSRSPMTFFATNFLTCLPLGIDN